MKRGSRDDDDVVEGDVVGRRDLYSTGGLQEGIRLKRGKEEKEEEEEEGEGEDLDDPLVMIANKRVNKEWENCDDSATAQKRGKVSETPEMDAMEMSQEEDDKEEEPVEFNDFLYWRI